MRITTTIGNLYRYTKLDMILRESWNVDQSNFGDWYKWKSLKLPFNFHLQFSGGKRVNVKISKVEFMLFYCNTYLCFCCMCFLFVESTIYFPRLMLLCITQARKCSIRFRKGLRIKELKHSNLLGCWYALMCNLKTVLKYKKEMLIKLNVIDDSLQQFMTKPNLKFIKCTANVRNVGK